MDRPSFSATISEQSILSVERGLEPSVSHGADLRFHGVVRELEDGKPIRGILYTHYEGMALRELERIGEGMTREFPVHCAFVHHRVGLVPAGEASLLIRVQTPHSAAAFEICHRYLGEIKKTVPIWKEPVWA